MTISLVTGANRGIGLELCRVLHMRGHEVIAVCRHASAELAALGVRIEADVDTGDEPSLRALADRLKHTRIDWLIANAGILHADSLETLDLASVRQQLEINAVGTLATAALLAPHVRDGGKVALVTSRMGSLADNSSGGYYGYRMSKAALNAAGVSLAHDLRGRKIAVVLLHPGYVRTDMTSGQGNVTSSDAARQLVDRISELRLERSGSFVHANGETLPW